MKILCLHGRGTRGEILATQTEGFRALFPDEYDYVFPDGEKEQAPAPGAEKIFPGPYLSFLTDYAVRSVADQHEYVDEIIAEEGPFDVVIGFSQGAALAGSVLLHHEMEKPWEPAPFRAAVFISSVYPYSRSPSAGVDVTDIVPADERLDTSDTSDSSMSSQEDLSDTLVRRLTPQSVRVKIRIPTAHIYGRNDSLVEESKALLQMCDESLMSTFVHQGGHDIPLSTETSRKIHDTIEETFERSQMMS